MAASAFAVAACNLKPARMERCAAGRVHVCMRAVVLPAAAGALRMQKRAFMEPDFHR
jgi:hypothetical protein